jgi:predicted MFS family arabinose efflux permease
MTATTTVPATRAGVARVMAAACLASTIGGLPFNSLPLMLGSLADRAHLSAAAAGMLGSTCFAGYLLGTLGAPLWMNRADWRVLTIVSAAGTAAAFALSALAGPGAALYAAWALIGFFASTMTCLGMRILNDLPDKERAFGMRQGTELAVTAAVLFALPPLVLARWGYPGAALALAGVVALLGVSAWWLPRRPAIAAAALAGARAPIGRAPVAAMAVFFLFLTGNIGLWAFIERIGVAQAIVPAQMGIVFAVLKLLGGVAAFAVALAGARRGPRLPFVLVTAGVAAGLALLHAGGGFATFALGAWIWEFAFTCGCVFQTAAIARTDSSGRVIVLVPAVFACSSMVGPGLAGQLASGGGFGGLLLLALASTLVPLLFHGLRRAAPAAAALGARSG